MLLWQVSDAKLILSTLIMGMKTLLYSIANYGNTQQPRTPSAGPTLVLHCASSVKTCVHHNTSVILKAYPSHAYK